MIEFALREQIVSDPTVAALIDARMYPVQWPDDYALPLVTYQRISTVTENLPGGSLSLCTVRMQYDVWAGSYVQAKEIAEATNAVLEGFQGPLLDGTSVDNIVLDSSFDLFDSPSRSYRVSTDYLITYTRT